MLRKLTLTLSLLGLLLIGQCYAAGPFGFEYGMTQEQVVKLVGRTAVKEIKPVDGSPDIVLVELNTAPKPHPLFESYLLYITPDKGLMKISALGKDVQTNPFGTELHDQFMETRDAVAKIYGTADTIDTLLHGSIWSDPQDWMMGLIKKERLLSAFWNLKSAPVNHITVIGLDGYGLSTERGYLKLSYEFEGWEGAVDAHRAKAATNF